MIGTIGPPAGGAAPPALPPTAAMFHIAENGKSQGPFTMAQMQEAIASGRVTAATMIWTTGMPAWAPAGQVPTFAAVFGPPPLPSP